MVAGSETVALGLTTEGAPPGRLTPTEDLCSAARFEGGEDRSGVEPASAASVRAEGPRAVRGERARLEKCNAPTGDRVSPPAKSQQVALEGAEVGANAACGLDPCGSATEISTAQAPPSPKTTRALSCRVDALVLAFKVSIDARVDDEISERQAIANVAGSADLRLGGLFFELKRSRKPDVVSFRNADLRGVFDPRGSAGWNLEIVVAATFLATHSLLEALALLQHIASACGHVEAERLRRFDLALDLTGFPLHHDDFERIATTRTRVDGFLKQPKDTDEVDGELVHASVREHHQTANQVTGFTIGAGNTVMARIYDKSTELALSGREEKRAIEYEHWGAAGWDGVAAVTRVEFQHRGSFLDEIRLRNPSDLEGKLDAVWQHDVKWLRLIEPQGATRRTRAPLDPRWRVVAASKFHHVAQPIARTRLRGGAKPEHVLGAAISRQAAIGRLQRVDNVVTPDGEVIDVSEIRNTMTQGDALRDLRARLHDLHLTCADDELNALTRHEPPCDALVRYITKCNAKVARFSSVDDTTEPKNDQS